MKPPIYKLVRDYEAEDRRDEDEILEKASAKFRADLDRIFSNAKKKKVTKNA